MNASPYVDRRHEDGISLAEMLVTLFVLGIVLTMATTSAFGLFNITDRAVERNVNADESRLAVAVASRALRAAVPPPTTGATQPPAFVTAQPRSVTLYSRLGETDPTAAVEERVVPVRVELSVNNVGQLIESVVDPTIAANGDVTYTSAARRRVAAQHVSNDATEPVFTYLLADGSERSTLTTLAQRESVRGVRITMLTSRDAGRLTPAQRVTTEVRVVNSLIADQIEEDG